MPLRDVLQRLADYQGSRLLLLDEQAGRRLVSGNFNLNQAADAFAALATTEQLRTHNLAGQLIIVR
ncbi:hypothetical protein D3C75_1277060 [compost metagenome]